MKFHTKLSLKWYYGGNAHWEYIYSTTIVITFAISFVITVENGPPQLSYHTVVARKNILNGNLFLRIVITCTLIVWSCTSEKSLFFHVQPNGMFIFKLYSWRDLSQPKKVQAYMISVSIYVYCLKLLFVEGHFDWNVWQSPRGKRVVTHWASMLRWIWPVSECNLTTRDSRKQTPMGGLRWTIRDVFIHIN